MQPFYPKNIKMKIPKSMKRFCPFCRKHSEHKVTQTKKKTASSLKHGSKYRAKKRGLARGAGSLGRYSKPPLSKFKMTGKKNTKKTDLRYKCSSCSKTHAQSHGTRTKKAEFV